MDADAPAAAQISQADIIERQAESIARLKRQVKKAIEYKQLTKSKLKEAAARLKEYREHVEALREEGETLKKLLKDEKNSHEKSKRSHQNALKQAVKAVKQKTHAATQTQRPKNVTQASQTRLSGQVEQTRKRTTVDSEVQTETMVVDTLTSRKRARGHADAAVRHEVDQFMPRLSRHLQETTLDDVPASESMLVLTAMDDTTVLPETSAALDAELALSDSGDDGEETLQIDDGQKNARAQDFAMDSSVLGNIDMPLEVITHEDDKHGHAAALEKKSSGKLLLGNVNPSILHEIDKELGSSSEDDEVECDKARAATGGLAGNDDSKPKGGQMCLAAGEKSHMSVDIDAVIASAIDKDLVTSSDEECSAKEDGVCTRLDSNTKQAEQVGETANKMSHWKDTQKSIDEELDDEFAALDAESDTNSQAKADGSCSGSSSSDSSDSSSSDESAGVGDDSMTGNGTNADDNTYVDPVDEKVEQTKGQHIENDGDSGAQSSLLVDKDVVSLAVVVEPNCVSTLEDMISPTSDVKLPAPDSVQPDSAVALVAIEDKLSSAETYQPGSVRNSIQNSVPTSGAIIDGADNSAASGTQFSTGQNLSKRPTPVTHNGRVDGPPELEAQFTTRSKSAPDVPVGSFATSTVYGEQAAEACCTDEQTVEASIVVEQHALRELRNVDEANLESHQGILQKRMKLNDGTGQVKRESGAPVQSAQVLTGDKVVQTESDATGEARDDQRMRKYSRSALQRAVRLCKGENPDKAYARRTISFLVKLCCRFTNTCPEHVMSLCQVLVSAYRKLRISPMLVVRGSLSVFRTPRSRRLMQESELGLSWLCNQVLIRVMCNDSEDLEHDGSIAPESLSLSLVDVCLLHLRGLLLEERTSVGDFLSDDSPHVHVATRSNITSHDIVFLAQTCALYTHLCRSSGRLFASRVLLFDLVRENPNIRGLHFARVMLEIYPAMLEREFDQHCVERQQILRETLQQALVFISSVSAAKQELLLHQASTTMLHAIAGALQMPELEEVDGNDPSLPRAHVEKLFGKVSVHCRSSQPRLQDDVVQSPVTAEHFALAKSMELCAAVYGLDLVTEVCSIDRCQELYNETNVENKIGIMYIVSHIATTFFSKTCDTQTSKTGAQQYVDDVVEWMYHVLSTDTTSSPEDHHKLMLGCATVCVDLVLEFPSPAGFEARRRALCAVVHWFDTIPSDKLIDLPATFLRRLRLAVVAARPHAIGK